MGVSVLVKDYPANVSMFENGGQNRYKIIISGTSDVDIPFFRVNIQGLTDDDRWIWLGEGTKNQNKQITAGIPFSHEIYIDNMPGNYSDIEGKGNFIEYKEIILSVNNMLTITFDGEPSWDEVNESIPDAVPDGYIMATISNFNIKLVDTLRTPVTGNMGDYYYCIGADGLTYDYRMARWDLTGEAFTKAKQPGAKIELTVNVLNEELPVLDLIWQDHNRSLWWQDQSSICLVDGQFGFPDGVTWDPTTKKLTIELDYFINDERFFDAQDIKLVIACWWSLNNGFNTSIDTFKITQANIVN